MAKRKRLCMVSIETKGEEHTDEALDDSNGHSSQPELPNDGQKSENHPKETNGHSSQLELPNDGQISENHPEVEEGPTKKKELWDMEKNKKIKVTFNRYGKPIGEEGNELTQFLGSIVRRSANVDLNCCDWRKVSMNKKEDMYSIVKIVARQTDKRVNPEQFKDLVTQWMDPKYQEICEKKRDSREKMEEPHVIGTKSFARLAHEEAMKKNGKELTWGEIYDKRRTRKNGNIVNEKAARVVAALHAVATDSTNTHTLDGDWINDDLSKVKGPEKRGYVRCIGKMPSVKDNGTSSSADPATLEQRLAQTEGLVGTLVNIIREHIPGANLTSILRNMNMEISDNYSMDRNNLTNGNERSSAGSGINNNFTL